jgi:1-acyl-sn-glycerol-3-phosphate acyltransferase
MLAGVARLAAAGLCHSMETEGLDRIPRDRPVLLVANHFNGMVDAVVLVAALGRLPRFLAKATLWKIVVVRPLLALAGLIPVHRSQDGPAGSTNESTFAAAERVLRSRGTVAVFPEGITHDRLRLAPVRTGAARIALGAAARGVRGVMIVPVGITFYDKVALRTRVVVRAGRPIDLDRDLGDLLPQGAEASDADHESVRLLTEEIRSRLQDVSPDFDSLLEGAALTLAAEVVLRTGLSRHREPVSLARREALAARLGDLPAEDREQITDAFGRYNVVLDLIHVDDDQLVPRTDARSVLRRVVGILVAVVVLAPLALAGVLINAIPAVIVALAGVAVRAPVTKGTVRLLVGLVVFPATWLALAWFDVGAAWVASLLAALTFPLGPLVDAVFQGRDGFWPSLLVFVTAPIFGFCAIYLLDRSFALVREWLAWHALVARRAQVDDVLAHRAGVVTTVQRLLDGRADAGETQPRRLVPETRRS